MQITSAQIIRFIEGAAARIKQHRSELIELDSPIGDADHGNNLDRGFTAAVEKLPSVAEQDIGTILKTTGMTLISTVGGAAGPLYGTAFIRAGQVLSDRQAFGADEGIAALEAALQGIMLRGKAERGEKTMIDAIAPGIDVLKEAQANSEEYHSAGQRALSAVEEGMRATIPMLAKKGRASYLGERSIGHQDPGATSAFYIAQALFEAIQAS